MKKILCVDDNVVSLSTVKGILGDIYEVVAVTSGEQALRFLETETPDLILLDIEMPGMSGYDTLIEMRSRFPRLKIPIIFLTGVNASINVQYGIKMGLKYGVVDYILKPFDSEKLMLKIFEKIDF